jgi:hypothetical protein
MSDEAAIWDAYNLLLLGPDIERLRKLLARYELFRKTIDIPGDIVECGVLKGTSLMFFLKLLHIHSHGSNKRVIGFDMFDSFPVTDAKEAAVVNQFLNESGFEGITTDSLFKKMVEAGLETKRCDLVAGDIRQTAAEYVALSPGLRISLLHLDLDLEDATYAALEAFWPRVVMGGLVIFDEYAVARWTESNAVDRYFANQHVQLKTLSWSRTPTAYIVKGSDNAKS